MKWKGSEKAPAGVARYVSAQGAARARCWLAWNGFAESKGAGDSEVAVDSERRDRVQFSACGVRKACAMTPTVMWPSVPHA